MTKHCNHQPDAIHFDHEEEATVCDDCGEVQEQYVSLGDVVDVLKDIQYPSREMYSAGVIEDAIKAIKNKFNLPNNYMSRELYKRKNSKTIWEKVGKDLDQIVMRKVYSVTNGYTNRVVHNWTDKDVFEKDWIKVSREEMPLVKAD